MWVNDEVGWDGMKKLGRLAVGNPCVVRLTEDWVLLADVRVKVGRWTWTYFVGRGLAG